MGRREGTSSHTANWRGLQGSGGLDKEGASNKDVQVVDQREGDHN